MHHQEKANKDVSMNLGNITQDNFHFSSPPNATSPIRATNRNNASQPEAAHKNNEQAQIRLQKENEDLREKLREVESKLKKDTEFY